MKFKTVQILNTLVLVLIISSCAKKATDATSDSYDASLATVESGVTAISGVADDLAGSAFSFNDKLQSKPSFIELLLTRAYATSCARPITATCNTGVRSMTYSCDLPSGLRSMSGSASLTYSNTSCSMGSVGDYVTRDYDLSINGPLGGVVSASSAVKTDYNGLSYGGGGRLTRRATNYELDILGKHKSYVRNNNTLYSVSMRTITPLQMNGATRAGRQLTSGQIEINHNVAKFTATMSFSNLVWNAACCHPISGTAAITFTGSKTGSASLTFNGCGTAQMIDGGQTQNFELSYCE